MFPNYAVLASVALIIPISTAECELFFLYEENQDYSTLRNRMVTATFNKIQMKDLIYLQCGSWLDLCKTWSRPHLRCSYFADDCTIAIESFPESARAFCHSSSRVNVIFITCRFLSILVPSALGRGYLMFVPVTTLLALEHEFVHAILNARAVEHQLCHRVLEKLQIGCWPQDGASLAYRREALMMLACLIHA